MANFSIATLHCIGPSTILSWFGPWLFTFAKVGAWVFSGHPLERSPVKEVLSILNSFFVYEGRKLIGRIAFGR